MTRNKLSKQKTSGKCLEVKTEVLAELDEVIRRIVKPTNSLTRQSAANDAAGTSRIAAIESDLQEIKTVLKDALAATNRKKTWAEVAA